MCNICYSKPLQFFLTIILILILTLPINADSKIIVKFAHLSDTHLDLTAKNSPKRLLGDSSKFLNSAIKYINKQNDINFAIFTGDMTNSPTESALSNFIKLVNSLKIIWYPVLGNHDVAVKSKYSKQKITQILKLNKTYYSKKINDKLMLIVLDGTTDKIVSCHGYFDSEQITWLDLELKNNKNSIIILALHFPLIPPGKSNDHFIIEQDRQKLDSLLKKYQNIAMVLSGHYHMDKISKVDGVIHVSSPALVQFPNNFKIITIYNNGDVKFKTISVALKNLLGSENQEILLHSERIEKTLNKTI